MEISQEYRRQIEKIIADMKTKSPKCLKNYQCYESSLEKLCRIKGVSTYDEIKCFSEEARCCGLSFPSMSKRYCNCPLRRYISVNFHR